MPLYEYRCASCDHRFEVLQRLGDDATGVECPHCGARQVEKLLSTFAARGASPGSGFSAAPSRASCGGGGFS